MVSRNVGARWLAAIALLGCGASNPASTVSLASAPAPADRAFEPGTADPERKARLLALAGDLDRLFRAKLEETGATAMAAGILIEGELVYQQALGVRDVASGAPVDADSVFRIGSLSKSFTALSVLKLRDDAEAGPVRRSTLRELHAGQRWSRASDKDAPVLRRTLDGLRLSASNYGFGWQTVTTCTEEGRVQHGGYEPGYFATVMMLPRERIALFVLSTTGAVGRSAYAAVFDVLRAGGVLTPPAVRPTAALEAARTAIDRLLGSWDPAVFRAAFDPHSARYGWNADLPAKLAALAREHGACRSTAPIEAYDGSHGSFRSTCERGAIEFEVLLAPTTPPRMQALSWRQRFPLDEELGGEAEVLTYAVGRGLTDRDSEMLAPSVDFVRAVRLLNQLGEDHGTCELDQGELEIEHAPPSPRARTMRLKLACTSGPLELSVGLDEAGKIVSLSGHAPHAPDATCWL